MARFNEEKKKYETGKRKKEPTPIQVPPLDAIPEEWNNYLEPLEVIANFTNNIEGDLILQQDVYVQFILAEAKLSAFAHQNNFVAEVLYESFHKRFNSTTYLTLSHLAYIFTSVGLDEFRSLPND